MAAISETDDYLSLVGSRLYVRDIIKKWSKFKEEHMPVNLSIKNVPDELVERLKERAKRHHRSLQGELMATLEEALNPRRLTVEEA